MWNYRCQAFDLAPIKEPLKRYVHATKVESNTMHRPIITCTHPTRLLKPTVFEVLNVTSINCFMWAFFYFNGWVLLPATVRTWLLASGNDSDPLLVAHCSGDHYTPKPRLLYPHGHLQSTQLQHEYFTCASHVPPPPILYPHPNPSIIIMVWHHLHAQVTICLTDTRPNLASHQFHQNKDVSKTYFTLQHPIGNILLAKRILRELAKLPL